MFTKSKIVIKGKREVIRETTDFIINMQYFAR